jgi:dihydrofolate reductase
MISTLLMGKKTFEILPSGFGGQAATDQLAAIDRTYCISKRLINFE